MTFICICILLELHKINITARIRAMILFNTDWQRFSFIGTGYKFFTTRYEFS